MTKLILSSPKYYKGKVGKTPGSTVKLNLIKDPKIPYHIIDLPGFGKMIRLQNKQEVRIQEQILDYIKFDAQNIFLCVVLANLVRLEDELDKYYFKRKDTIPLTIEFILFILNHHVPCILVLNKMDKLNSYDLKRVRDKLDRVLKDFDIDPYDKSPSRILKIFETSTLKKQGTQDVINFINKKAQKINFNKFDPRNELHKKETVDVLYEKKIRR